MGISLGQLFVFLFFSFFFVVFLSYDKGRDTYMFFPRHIMRVRLFCGWLGGAMVLGKLPVPGRPTIWIIVGQGPTVLAVGAGGGGLDIFSFVYPFSPLSPSLWETA